MNFVAAMLLKVFDGNVYDSFIAMHYIMTTLNWRFVYLPSTPKLSNLLKVVEKKIADENLSLFRHLRNHQV